MRATLTFGQMFWKPIVAARENWGKSMKIVTGKVTFNVGIHSVADLNKVSNALAKTGYNFWIKSKDNQVVVKGKNVDTQKIITNLKDLGLESVSLKKIEVDSEASVQKEKVRTTEILFEDLCCEENAKTIKSKLSALKGVDGVKVNVEDKKVMVTGKLDTESVLEAALAIGKAKLKKATSKENEKAVLATLEDCPSEQSLVEHFHHHHQPNTVIVFPEEDYMFSDKNPHACSIM